MHLRLRKQCRRVCKKTVRNRRPKGLLLELSPTKDRQALDTSAICLSEQELNNDNSNRKANQEGGKRNGALPLDEELQATNDCCEQGKWSSPGLNTLTGCSISTGQT